MSRGDSPRRLISHSKQDNARSLCTGRGKQIAKIKIKRQHDSILAGRFCQDLIVWQSLQS